MAATMNLPGIGQVKSTYVYAGAAVAGGVVLVAYMRKQSAAAAENTGVDETAGTYDAAAEASAESTYGYDYSASGYDYGGISVGGSYPDYRYPSYTSPVYSGTPSTNPEWSDQVQEELTDRGVEALAISSAVGRYLAKLCLSDAQADIIRQAIAAGGEPPQGQYSVTVCPPSGGGTPPPSGGGGTGKPGRPAGLRVVGVGKNSMTIDWSDVPGATGYEVWRSGSLAGRTSTSRFSLTGLKPGLSYSIGVRATNAAGRSGMAQIRQKTKR